MKEQREVVISRTYQKGPDRLDLFVAQVSGAAITGQVFQFESWLNHQEQAHERVTSGNKYDIRKVFMTELPDLAEDGWSQQNRGIYGPESAFFDPDKL